MKYCYILDSSDLEYVYYVLILENMEKYGLDNKIDFLD